MKTNFGTLLSNVRNISPLVHHITNYVTVNDCANICLAIGASPVMGDETDDAMGLTSIASSLVINMGTPNQRTVKSMKQSIATARERNIPIVFDPVGVGATGYRNTVAAEIMELATPDVIRCNMSEIKALAGMAVQTKGVDSIDDENEFDNDINTVKTLAKKLNCVLAITGKRDLITDGENLAIVDNGVPEMKRVTGCGCMTTTLVGAFLGANPTTPWEATVAGVAAMGIAGNLSNDIAKGRTSTLRTAIIDSISTLSENDFVSTGKITFI